MAVVYSKVLLFDPPLIYTAPDICVFGAVLVLILWNLKIKALENEKKLPVFCHKKINRAKSKT